MGRRGGSSFAFGVAFVATSATCAAGCATGGAGDEGFYEVPEAGGGTQQHDGGGDAFTRGVGDDGAGPADTGPGGDAGADDGGDAADGAGDDGGSDSGSIACTSPNTCQAATNLGKMSGDTSGPDLSGTGDTAEWFVADVTENDSSPLGVPMKLKVTLTSPPGMNFDLYVYLGADVNAIECTTVKASSTNGVGQTDSVSFEWGELGALANGVDDSRHVSVEVRWISGTCDPSTKWTLDLHGH